MGNNIELAFKVLESIEATNSSTEKKDILEANKDFAVLKSLLLATYDPFIVYGIKKDPKVDCLSGTEASPEIYHSFMELLDILATRKLTGHAALNKVKNIFGLMSEREYKWYLKVLQRDLKIGITAKTINKVMPKLVPEFTCALANSWDSKKTPERFVADAKMDGYRCLAFNYEDRVELRSRNGHLLEGYAGIEKDVADYLPKGFVFDGEIMGREGTFNEVQKSAFKKVKKGEDDKDGVLYVFDVVQISEFEENNFLYPYEARLAFLDQITDILEKSRSLDRIFQTRPLDKNKPEDIESLLEFHRDNTERGIEGTMIKNLAAKYKMDKSNNILKMKDFYDIDLEVVGVYEGKEGTKYKGTMGGVIVQLSAEEIEKQLPIGDKKHAKKLPYIKDATFEVKVGSGWSDPDRRKYWNDPNLIIGRVIEIQFQELTINDDGGHSMRFPTLVKVRDDK